MEVRELPPQPPLRPLLCTSPDEMASGRLHAADVTATTQTTYAKREHALIDTEHAVSSCCNVVDEQQSVQPRRTPIRKASLQTACLGRVACSEARVVSNTALSTR